MIDAEARKFGYSDLCEFLDELTGVRAAETTVTQHELEHAEASALSVGFEERAIRRLHERQSAPRRHSFLRRVAANWLIVVPLVLLAAGPIWMFAWSGRNSAEELDFEVAMTTVFDERRPEKTRHSAFMHLAIRIKIGIEGMRRFAKARPKLEPVVARRLAYLRSVCDEPSTASVSEPFPAGRFRELLTTFERPDEALAEDFVAAAKDFVELAESGLAVMYLAQNIGPMFARDFKSQLGKIEKRFTKKLD